LAVSEGGGKPVMKKKPNLGGGERGAVKLGKESQRGRYHKSQEVSGGERLRHEGVKKEDDLDKGRILWGRKGD